jgi:hypothetical protein
VVAPDACTDAQITELEACAAKHRSIARFARGASGLSVDRLSVWAEEVLRPAVTASKAPDGRPVGGRAWVVAWDVGWVMSRLCRSWGPANGEFYGGWSLGMFDAPDTPCLGTGLPRLRVRQVREGVTLARWGSTPANNDGERPRRLPPVLDLRHLVSALAGPGIDTLEAACAEFEDVTGAHDV